MSKLTVTSDIVSPLVCEELLTYITNSATLARIFDLGKAFSLFLRMDSGEKLQMPEKATAWIIGEIIDLWLDQNKQFMYDDFCFEVVDV